MTDPLHHQLLGHLLGALDDDEQQWVDAHLEQDEQYSREWMRWRRRLCRLEAMRPDYEPPPGLAERACRYVEDNMSAAAVMPAVAVKTRMSSCPAPPGCVGYIGWPDGAMILLLLMIACAVIFPAIDASRFCARLASCQDRLSQFGLALSQYGNKQQSTLTELANNGRLTAAGAFAARRLREVYFAHNFQDLYPDAWLAVQEALPPPEVGAISNIENWPGTWRIGTNDGRRLPPSPAAAALLADAPSADMPGQSYSSHGGLGRNFLFEDGRVDFIYAEARINLADGFRTLNKDRADPSVSAPVIYVSGR